ncbi:MAG: universal stress protein [Hyphomicrobium zavarzinii]|jgi:nucleotide-binding universal stress UspA family protein|uniref:universal stress protein n=1 Tax=Hyphomicrobium TaxID=81 RepID=UPI0003821EDE|nr:MULTISPECIES: universal stress protein [Hyphomicrobium]MBL8845058.1 universal stress protein [Hyphomicrobium zavarzinii]WBT39986.1 universal stress protein [Hyphomicrobium sp. DMF-1]HML41917.1 universal stress protein [Hyphomicrobium zavarzinii]
MFKHILIATDGSELAQKAVTQGLELAKGLGAQVTVINVTEPWAAVAPGEVAMAFPIHEYEESVATNAARILSAVDTQAKAQGVTCATLHVKDQFPAEGIIETAGQRGCDVIVMASHGRRGLMRFLLGSQAIKVLTNSTIPVLVCR